MNTVLLGAVSALPENPIKQESFKQAMANRLKGKYIDLNLQAFQMGRESVLIGYFINSPLLIYNETTERRVHAK